MVDSLMSVQLVAVTLIRMDLADMYLIQRRLRKLAYEAKDKHFPVDTWLYTRPWLKSYLIEPMPVIQAIYTNRPNAA